MNSRVSVFLPLGIGLVFLIAAGLVWMKLDIAARPPLQRPYVPPVTTPIPLPSLSTSSSSVEGVGSPTQYELTASSTVVTTDDLSLLFVGDIMLDRKVALHIRNTKNPSYPFARLPVDWFKQADFTVANLEGVVTDKRRPPEKSIDFQFDPSVIPTLQATGIDAFSQANNHTLDQGREGAADAHRRLQEAGFMTFGDQVQDGEVALATTTIRGQRFAFLGFNTTDNPLDETAAARVLAKARAESDQVIVFMHWGIEYVDHAPQEVVNRSHWLIDHGADIVIGGHPHWVQGIYTYKGKPIVYSLGNFIFDQDFSGETRQGLAVKLLFKEEGLVIQPIPIQIDQSQPRPVEGAELQKRLDQLAKISQPEFATQIKQGHIELMK